MEEWDKIAWLCFHMPRFSKGSLKFEKFHPFRQGQEEMNITQMAMWMSEMRDYLPKTLTEEEIERKWVKFKDG